MHSHKLACHKQGIALFSTLVPIHRLHKRPNQAFLFISIQAFKSLNIGIFRDRVPEEDVFTLQSGCKRQRNKKKETEIYLVWQLKYAITNLSSSLIWFLFVPFLSPLCTHSIYSSFLSIQLFLPLSPWHWPVYIIDAKYMRHLPTLHRRAHGAVDEWSYTFLRCSPTFPLSPFQIQKHFTCITHKCMYAYILCIIIYI